MRQTQVVQMPNVFEMYIEGPVDELQRLEEKQILFRHIHSKTTE